MYEYILLTFILLLSIVFSYYVEFYGVHKLIKVNHRIIELSRSLDKTTRSFKQRGFKVYSIISTLKQDHLNEYIIADHIETNIDITLKNSHVVKHNEIAKLIAEQHIAPSEFAEKLKKIAAKRKLILTNSERIELIGVFLRYINDMDPTEISNCIWALGILRITRSDFLNYYDPLTTVNNSNSNSNRSSSYTTAINNIQQFNNIGQFNKLMMNIDRCYSSYNQLNSVITDNTMNTLSATDVPMIVSEGGNVSTESEVKLSIVDMLRTVSGLAKMKFQWNELPVSLKDSFITYTSDSNQLLSRELSSAIYTLGQLNATRDDLPSSYISKLLDCYGRDDVMQGLTSQGFVNTLHGIVRMGLTWSDLDVSLRNTCETLFTIPQYGITMVTIDEEEVKLITTETIISLQQKILVTVIELLPVMRTEEFCSFLNSLALLKYDITTADDVFHNALLNTLLTKVQSMFRREITNIIWALGKINLKYKSLHHHVDKLSNEQLSQYHNEREELVSMMKDQLCTRLEIVDQGTSHMKAFDLESLLVGFGLMEIKFSDLTVSYQAILRETIEINLSQMNIFALHNTLLGLAKMQVNVSQLRQNLSKALLDRTMLVLHTFLPVHYGDVIWSLGALGYSKHNFMDISRSDRLLAVLSRVYGMLHVKAAVSCLQGLASMGYLWLDDFQIGKCSVPTGREAPPFSFSITKYIRQRVNSMREHEFSQFIFFLGSLQTPWSLIPVYAQEKIYHRVTRVTTFLTSQSLLSLFTGFVQMGVKWVDLPIDCQLALECALTVNNNTNNTLSTVVLHQQQQGKYGIIDMTTSEFITIVRYLGEIGYILDGKDAVQIEIYRKLESIVLEETEYDIVNQKETGDIIQLLNSLLTLNVSSAFIPPLVIQQAKKYIITQQQ